MHSPEAISPSAIPAGKGNSRGRVLLFCAALALLTLLIFGQAVYYGFIGFDDHRYIDENPALEAGLSWPGVKWAFSTNLTKLSETAEYWEPLTLLTRLADYQLYGFKPWGHHLTSILLHLATALALFGALRRLTGAVERSAMVAALFLVHPMHVEAVLWLSARKDLVSGLFFVLTLWAYGWYVARPGWRRYLVVFAAALAANMGKPMAVSLPFVLLLLDIWPLRRWSWEKKLWLGSARKLLLEKLPILALTLGVSVLAAIVQRHIGALDVMDVYPWPLRLGNAALSLAVYVGKALVPVRLAVFYPHPGHHLNVTMAAAAAFAVVLISEAVFFQWRRRLWLPIGWYWFLVVLAPVLGVIQIGDQAMADRYTYLSFIGLFIAVVWQVAEWLAPLRPAMRGKLAWCLALGSIAVYSTMAFLQVQTWRSSESLFAHALAVTADNYLAEYNLGVALWKKGEREAATHHFQEALRIRRPVIEMQIAAADAAAQSGAYHEAILRLKRALPLVTRSAELHQRLGAWLVLDHQPEKALAEFQTALEYNPDWAAPRVSIAGVLLAAGEEQKAALILRDVLAHEPANPEARAMLDTLQKRRASP